MLDDCLWELPLHFQVEPRSRLTFSTASGIGWILSLRRSSEIMAEAIMPMIGPIVARAPGLPPCEVEIGFCGVCPLPPPKALIIIGQVPIRSCCHWLKPAWFIWSARPCSMAPNPII